MAAYVRYTYVIEAANNYGSVTSSPVTFRTLPGSPTGMVIVYITNIQSQRAAFSWNQPVNMNGPLVNYSVTAVSPSRPSRTVHWTGLSLQANVTNFIPFTNYTVVVETCTPGGCLDSRPAQFITKSDMPASMKDPIITAISETKLLVTWEPPTEPNGSESCRSLSNISPFITLLWLPYNRTSIFDKTSHGWFKTKIPWMSSYFRVLRSRKGHLSLFLLCFFLFLLFYLLPRFLLPP